MTFSRIRAFGAWTGTIDSSELDQIDANLSNAIDGGAGGTYAPSSVITIGGSGLTCSGAFQATGGAVCNTLTVSGTSTLTGAVACGASLAVSTTLAVVSTATVGALQVTGTSTLVGTVTCSGDATITGIGTIGTLSVSGAAGVGGLLTALGGVATTTLAANSISGTFVRDVATAPDADHTYLPTDGEFIVVPGTGITGTHIYSLSSSGAVEGHLVELVNKSAYSQTFEANAGITSVSVAAGATKRMLYSSIGGGAWLPL